MDHARGDVGDAHLDTAGGHVELGSELAPEASIRLCVAPEDILESLELCAGCSLAVLDFVGGVGEESAEVDCRIMEGVWGEVIVPTAWHRFWRFRQLLTKVCCRQLPEWLFET